MMKQLVNSISRLTSFVFVAGMSIFVIWSWVWCMISDAKNDRYGWLIFDIIALPISMLASMVRYSHYLLISFGLIGVDLNPSSRSAQDSSSKQAICAQIAHDMKEGLVIVKAYQDLAPTFELRTQQVFGDTTRSRVQVREALNEMIADFVVATETTERAIAGTRTAASKYAAEKCDSLDEMPNFIAKLDQWTGGLTLGKMMISNLKQQLK